MAPSVEQTTRIFEDTEPPKSVKAHRRVPSVGDVLRGRRRENSPTKNGTPLTRRSPSPLGERHINSPPQTKKVPVKKDDGQGRPIMHKKIGSSVSLKEMIMGKEKTSNTGSLSSTEGYPVKSPKKVKSSTNLAALLKKRSKRNLNENDKQGNSPPSPTKDHVYPTTFWTQSATKSLQSPQSQLHYPQSQDGRIIEADIKTNTPMGFRDREPAEQRDCQDGQVPASDYKPPQRPFLEHKTSRSSIFTENMDDDDTTSLQRSKCGEKAQSSSGTAAIATLERPKLDTRPSDSSTISENRAKRSSRVMDVITTFNMRSRKEDPKLVNNQRLAKESMSPQEVESAFEKVLDSLNIAQNLRDNMRSLKADVKVNLIRSERVGSGSSTSSAVQEMSDVRGSARSPYKRDKDLPKTQDDKEDKRSRSRSRPRSRILTMSKRDETAQTKQDKHENSTRSRSKSRSKVIDGSSSRPVSSRSLASTTSLHLLATTDSATRPGDFIHYLREVQKPELVDVGKLHKLRILLRNESITWTDSFVTKGGMDELISLLYRIAKIEWREEHEDSLLHENLLCLKALCTTSLALQRIEAIEKEFFPIVLGMLFDEEKKGPSEFITRGVIISLLFAHLSASMQAGGERLESRARTILGFLKDPVPDENKQPLDFVRQMHMPRPYRVWCKEVVNVTKEVFWIFLHHLNVVPVLDTSEKDGLSYVQVHFPPPRPPHPAAPYVGGVEWEATQYLANHLDLLNGLISSLSMKEDRNALREHLKQSGFEKIMGGSMRTCKEKFYGGIHEGLKVWVCAAKADGWPVEDVRAGPPREVSSPRKSPTKKKVEEAPKLALDLGIGGSSKMDGWA